METQTKFPWMQETINQTKLAELQTEKGYLTKKLKYLKDSGRDKTIQYYITEKRIDKINEIIKK